MPVKIIKTYRGTNIVRVERANGERLWGYRITINGKTFLRAGWRERADAEEARDRFKAKFKDPGYDPAWDKLTLETIKKRWTERARARGRDPKRIGEIEKCMDRLIEIARSPLARRLTEDDLLRYQESRLAGEKPKHNHTINKEMAMIRTCLLAARSLFPGFNWAPPQLDRSQRLPTLYESREITITDDEHAKILSALELDASVQSKNEKNTRHAESNIEAENARRAFTLDAYLVATESALRISELASIRKSDVNVSRGVMFPNGFVRVVSAKTQRKEMVPMTPKVAAILKRRCESVEGEYLFRRPGQSLRMAILMIRRGFQRACERAGVHYGLKTDGIVFHSIRHTTTTRILDSGATIAATGAITRHSKRTMVMRYAHRTPAAMARALEALQMPELGLPSGVPSGLNLESSEPGEKGENDLSGNKGKAVSAAD